jgi:hypothetical protein
VSDDKTPRPAAPNGPTDRRTEAVTSAIGVLERLSDPAVRDAVEVFRALRAGEVPSSKMIRRIETALLVRNMSPKLRDEGVDANETRTLLEAATSMFRVNPPLPTRQYVQRVYREFEAAFSKRPSKPDLALASLE